MERGTLGYRNVPDFSDISGTLKSLFTPTLFIGCLDQRFFSATLHTVLYAGLYLGRKSEKL